VKGLGANQGDRIPKNRSRVDVREVQQGNRLPKTNTEVGLTSQGSRTSTDIVLTGGKVLNKQPKVREVVSGDGTTSYSRYSGDRT
jgi:hypothetical protein